MRSNTIKILDDSNKTPEEIFEKEQLWNLKNQRNTISKKGRNYHTLALGKHKEVSMGIPSLLGHIPLE